MAERKHASALCIGREKSIGMYTDKQIGLDFSSLLHANMQGHKKVCIAGEVSPHRAALDLCGIDAVAQFEGNLQHHIFLFGTVRANGPWVFTAVSRVDGHDDQTIGDRRGRQIALRALGVAWHSRYVACGTGRVGVGILVEPLGNGVVALGALCNPTFQRVYGRAWVQIQDQAVLIIAHRREGEDLWLYSLFQVKHHANYARAILGNSNASDVGVVRLYFPHPFFDGRVEFQAF